MVRSNTRANRGWWVALGAVALMTALGFQSVLKVRFGGGEGYPNYSTLRADPLGARALFEALDRLPNVKSVRNFERIEKLDGKPGETLMLLNVNAHVFNQSGRSLDGGVVARWALGGGRVVITIDSKITPNRSSHFLEDAVNEVEEEERAKKKAEDEKKKNGDEVDPPPEASGKSGPGDRGDGETKRTPRSIKDQSLAAALKVSVTAKEFVPNRAGGSDLTLEKDLPLDPEDVPPWFSNVFLNDDPTQDWTELPDSATARIERVSKEKKAGAGGQADGTKTKSDAGSSEPSPWHLLARRGGRAMMMERSLGAGSVVVCTDSFFVSNEALWSNPKPKFLAWLVADARRVIFDETHLGSNIGDEDSLMTLARRYRMHGLFIGGMLLFVLYVWRNTMSLVPRDESRDLGYWRQDAVAGQSTASGLEGLLSRGIPRKQMLARCFDTWDSTPPAANMVPADRRAKARAALAEATDLKQVAASYRKLRDIIHPVRQ